jgi:hypothetical protein
LQKEAVRLDALAASCTKAIKFALDATISKAVIAPTIIVSKAGSSNASVSTVKPQEDRTGPPRSDNR